MSLKKIQQTKNGKWFSLWDLVAFGAIILTSVALILAFTVGKDKSALDGFFVAYRGEQVLTYDFREGTPHVLVPERVEVGEEKDGVFTIRFYTDDKSGYNDISVNVKKRSVSVVASNCSFHKDCVYTPSLTSNSSTPIICTPHALTVCPLTFTDDGHI